jgi:hypothetical protein
VARIEEVLTPGYLDGLEGWSLGDVRTRRDEATEVETGLSYLRRIIQGRLDILLAEQRRRRQGGGGGDLTSLVEELPSILSDHVHAPGLGRLPALMGPGELDPALEARLESVIPASHLATIDSLDDAEVSAACSGLVDLEKAVSSQRRSVFEVLDRLQDEIVRRYGTGEATVDSLLP